MIVAAAVVQSDCFHRDLNAEKVKISAAPAVNSTLFTHNEAASETLHTQSRCYTDTFEHGRKHRGT